MRTRVKICGVRSPEIARVVAEAEADFMGLIFAPSKRTVTPEQARAIVASLGDRERRPLAVGIFVNESPERMAALAEEVGFDIIQLSGDEPPDTMARLNRPAIKVLSFPAGTGLDEARRAADAYLDAPVPARALLLDSHVVGSYGGNGITGDWALAAALAETYPVFLAGGLRPESAAEAVTRVRPLAVDVSSGVETNGTKDPDKIRRFIAAAREANQEPSWPGAADLVEGGSLLRRTLGVTRHSRRTEVQRSQDDVH